MTIVRRIMEKFRMNEISGVDTPAQEHARMTIMKRADVIDDAAFEDIRKRKFTAAERKEAEANGHAMPGGRYPINDKEDLENAIHAVGRGKGSHADIRAHIRARAQSLGATGLIPDDWKVSKIAKAITDDIAKFGLTPDEGCTAETFDDLLGQQKLTAALWNNFYQASDALRESICSIIKDGDIADKRSLIQQSLNEFADYIDGVIPGGVGKSLATGFVAAVAGSAGPTLNNGVPMSNVTKALGLADNATEADILKALADKDAAVKKADVLAKMSAKHKAHHEKLEGAAADKFAAMSPDERDKESGDKDDDVEKALKSGDAFKAVNGQIITKKAAGAMFDVLKAQDAEIVKSRGEIAKANEEKEVASFAKRATGLGFPEAFGATMRKAYSGDAAAQAEVEKQLAALKKQAEEGGLFNEMGKRGGHTAGTAYAELIAKRDDLRKAQPKLKEAQAFEKVYTDPANAEIVKRYKAESAPAN